MSSDATNTTWNAATIAEKIIGIVVPKAYTPVSLESSFISLGLDSLAMAEIVFEIEAAFGIRTNERLLELNNLHEMAQYVHEELAKAGRIEPAALSRSQI